MKKLSHENVLSYLTNQRRPHFAIWNTGTSQHKVLSGGQVKDLLAQQGIPCRYQDVEATGLSAAVLLHRKVQEIWIVNNPEQTVLAETIGIQDIDDWTLRDRSKPFAQRKKGMLPPKVARMMVNIGLGQLENSANSQALVFDPFCGSGTVLMEAALRGAEIWGSDASTESVAGAQANLAWLNNQYQLTQPAHIFTADATHISNPTLDHKVDAIVTEPFLGKPKPKPEQVPNIIKGLEKLYLGAFKNWQHLLHEGSVVVMVFPRITTAQRTYTWQSFIDKLGQLGYTTSLEPVVYGRAQAITARELYILKYKQQS